ncbi:hypothetical protein BDV12DRAFT_190536 [Aspergillus spectabilis]
MRWKTAPRVEGIAQRASQLVSIRAIVHTPGLSTAHALVDRIYSVDLLGTAHLSADLERHLARAPVAELLSHPDLAAIRSDPTVQLAAFRGYAISKRANILRVQASAGAWRKKGARISPGLVLTPMGHQELAGPLHDQLRDGTASNPILQVGKASDIANVVAFLSSPEASFVTGTDLLIDGGWLTSMRWNR